MIQYERRPSEEESNTHTHTHTKRPYTFLKQPEIKGSDLLCVIPMYKFGDEVAALFNCSHYFIYMFLVLLQ